MAVHPLQQHLIGVGLHLRDNVASRVEGQMHMRVNKTGQQRDIAKINDGQPGRDAAASQVNRADTAAGHDDQRRTGMEGLTIEQAPRTQPPPATVGDLRSTLIHRVTSGAGRGCQPDQHASSAGTPAPASKSRFILTSGRAWCPAVSMTRRYGARQRCDG
jgi:hypothetical protein